MSKFRKRVYMSYSQDEGCRMHRVLCPARFLRRDLPGVTFHASARADEYAQPYDAYLIHGLPMPETIAQMGGHVSRGQSFLWGVDDDLTSVPPWNPCKPPEHKLQSFYVTKRVADWIVVSTDHLATTFADVADKVVVAPNLLDLTQYPHRNPPPEPEPGKQALVVLWAGSHTHLLDVKPVVRAVDHVLQKYAGFLPVEFVFFGQAPPEELVTKWLHRGVAWVKPVELSMYWGVLGAIRPHITLAPLYDCEFNLSKSNIRVLDGWASCSAVVASPVGEYRAVEDGVDGLYAADEDAWVDRLETLIQDHALRRRLALAGRARVEAECDWNNPACRAPWREAFARMLGVPRAEEVAA